MHRPQSTEMMVDPHLAQWAVRALTRVMAFFAVGIGIQILAGGAGRFAGLSYQAALATPGAPWSWGLVILIAGCLTLTGTLLANARMVAGGLTLASAWAFFFAASFLQTAATYPTANTTAPWVYSVPIGVGCFLLAGVHLSMDLPAFLYRLRRKVRREAP